MGFRVHALDYAIDAANLTDREVEADATAGNVVVTLPPAARVAACSVYRVDSSGNTLTVAAFAGDTVDGGASVTIVGGAARAFRSDGLLSWKSILLPGSVDASDIADGAVTLAKMANIATARIVGRTTAASGVPEALDSTAVKGMLSLSAVENTALSTWAGSANVTTVGTLVAGAVPWSLITGTKNADQLGGATFAAPGAIGGGTPAAGTFTALAGSALAVTGLSDLGTTAGITASTTQTQGQGPLTATVNAVSVCANASDTVTLPAAVAGRLVLVINNGAQTLQVFPASGDDLGGGVDAATTIVAGSRKLFWAFDATTWEPVI